MATKDEGLKSSASVDFSIDNLPSGRRLVIETDSTQSLLRLKGTSYVRVYPSFASPKITALMGTASIVGGGIPEEVTDYISFTGSASAGLKYPPLGAVEILEMTFFNSEPAVGYHAETNSLILDGVESHGIVKVRYTTLFDRYLVGHGDAPCLAAARQTLSLEQGGGAGPASPNYDPAFLVATAEGWETASQEVAGPPCNQNDKGYNDTASVSDYEPVGIKVEVDALTPVDFYPEYFSAGAAPGGFTLAPQVLTINGVSHTLYCGCKVRVYPRNVSVTLIGVNCAVGSASSGAGTKPVLQSLPFSGVQSVNLDYPPSGSVSLMHTGLNALSLFNETVSIRLAGPGEWVNEVVWKNRTSYEMTQSARMVRPDEVVAVTSSGDNTIPVYTFAQAQYTSEYQLFDVLFHFDPVLNWYAPAMVFAVASDGRSGNISLEPPAKGGVL